MALNMTDFRKVPRDLLSRMPVERQNTIKELEEKGSQIHKQSTELMNADTSNNESISSEFLLKDIIPRFLVAKEQTVSSDLEYYTACLEMLADIQKTGGDDSWYDKVKQERQEILNVMEASLSEYRALTRSRRSLTADIEEQILVQINKKKKDRVYQATYDEVTSEKSAGTIRKEAFTKPGGVSMSVTPTTSLMGPKKKQKHPLSDQSEFKAEAVKYYDASLATSQNIACCQLTGIWGKETVKAVTIVPKSFSNQVLSSLFGSDEAGTRASPCNDEVEECLNHGLIAIIPVACGEAEQIPTRWQCVLLDKSMSEKTMRQSDNGDVLKYSVIDNKELVFRNDMRPRKRFMFLRLIICLLQAVRQKNSGIVHELSLDDLATKFWPSLPGEYLEKSMLKGMVRDISGLDLPESFLNHTTFDEIHQPDNDKRKGMLCDVEFRAASALTLEEIRRFYDRDDEDSEDSEDDAE